MTDVTEEFKFEIHMNYLHKGTKALLVKDGERIRVIADMDGHFVSPDYGQMFDAKRTFYSQNPERNYINVKIVAMIENYRGGARSAAHTNTPNSTIYETDGWMILVASPDHARYQRELNRVERAVEAEFERVKADLAHAEADLRRAREALDSFRK